MRPLAFAVFALISCTAPAQGAIQLQGMLRSDDWTTALSQITAQKKLYAKDLMACLWSKDKQIRARAAQSLWLIDSAGQDTGTEPEEGLGELRPDAVMALKTAASDPEDSVRKEAVWGLAYLLRNRKYGHHGEPRSSLEELQPLIDLGRIATPYLSQLLAYQDPKDFVLHSAKISAVRVLAQVKDPASVDALLELVKTAEGFLLSKTMFALIELDDPRVISAIIDRMDQGIPMYGGTPGSWALIELKEKAVPDLLWALESHPREWVRAGAAEVFKETIDSRAIPALLKAVGDPEKAVRSAAACTLAKYPGRATTQALISLLTDKSPDVRASAAKSLGALGETSAFEPVSALLSDSDVSVRISAAGALIKLDQGRALDVLNPLLRSTDLHSYIISALKLPIPPSTESALIDLIQGKSGEGVSYAVSFLGEAKSAAAVPALLRLAQEEGKISSSALSALGAIGRPSVEGLLGLLPASKGDKTYEMLEALGATKDPRCFDAIVSFLQDPHLCGVAIEALGAIEDKRAIALVTPYLSSSDGSLVSSAIQALGDLRSAAAVPFMIKSLENRNDYIDCASAVALGKISDPLALGALILAAQNPDFEGRWMAVEALGRIGGSSVLPVLIRLLDDDWPDNEAAARALGFLGDPAALPALEKAAKSDDEDLVEEALKAIKAIKGKRPAP